MVTAIDFSKALTVFFISIATVIGPTPPGTGVMKDVSGATFSKSTSPTRREPDLRVTPETRLIPTSITIAPPLPYFYRRSVVFQ